jgi:hypothetical protein
MLRTKNLLPMLREVLVELNLGIILSENFSDVRLRPTARFG